uniref:Uncharacterized protein n=1 Tax=uncultured marine crenarchaeote HF4000_APKG6C9 TaxID=455595 RepID=B3T8X7_9ARCH|nr:hypothetical protein ALOHA_HF4000APKG6C9ctg1g33 [uncultured marine crenarchaeote HF4000_APKG6C9]
MTHLSYQIIFPYNRLNLNMCVFPLIYYKQDKNLFSHFPSRNPVVFYVLSI